MEVVNSLQIGGNRDGRYGRYLDFHSMLDCQIHPILYSTCRFGVNGGRIVLTYTYPNCEPSYAFRYRLASNWPIEIWRCSGELKVVLES